MGARRQRCCCIYLCKRTNSGDTTEIFHHVTHNTVDCGLQEKPAIRCNECLPCQTMLPLCSCGATIWDTNPNTCANNCIFYKNPKGVITLNIKICVNYLVSVCSGY